MSVCMCLDMCVCVCVCVCARARARVSVGFYVGGKCDIFNVGVSVTVFVGVWAFSWL